MINNYIKLIISYIHQSINLSISSPYSPIFSLPFLSADCCILFTMVWVNGRYWSSTVLHLPQPIATRPLIPVDCHIFWWMAHGLLPFSKLPWDIYLSWIIVTGRIRKDGMNTGKNFLQVLCEKWNKQWLTFIAWKTLPSSHLQWNGRSKRPEVTKSLEVWDVKNQGCLLQEVWASSPWTQKTSGVAVSFPQHPW